jgi:hypothetical protein
MKRPVVTLALLCCPTLFLAPPVGCQRSPQPAIVQQAPERPQIPPPPPVKPITAPPRAEIRFPIPVIELHGSGAEIGIEHGRELAGPIHLLHDKYLKVYLRGPTERMIALAAAGMFESLLIPAHREEVAALAAQTGMDEREAMLAQCFLDLSPMVACSTVTLPAAAAPDGVARFGRNLDFPSLGVADKHSVVFIYHPTPHRLMPALPSAPGATAAVLVDPTVPARYQFAAVGWPGQIGVLSGMNEHGLALANMEVTRSPGFPSAMPYTMLYRMVLEQCRTVDEAIALLQRTPRQTPNNLMLMDATGARAVVEIGADSLVVRRGTDTQALLSTNHRRGLDCDAAGLCRRYDFLHRAAARDFGHIDEHGVEALLAGAAQGDATMQSMVFEPADRVLYLSTGKNAAKKPFYRLDLKPYFAK